MLWSLTAVLPFWYFSSRGLCWVETDCPNHSVTSLNIAVEIFGWGKRGLLHRRYGLDVAQDFLYFRALRSYKTGKVSNNGIGLVII